MMHFIIRFATPVICAATLISPLAVQASEGSLHIVNHRQIEQQRRIFKGVQDDQINRQEYRNLQQRSRSIELQQRRDVRDGGSLTPRERAQLDQRLNHLSKSIYRDRHD